MHDEDYSTNGASEDSCTTRLNIPCPRRILSDNTVLGGKEVVRNLVVSIYLSMSLPFFDLPPPSPGEQES